MIVGASQADGTHEDEGAAYIIYGGYTGTESTTALSQTGTDVADNFTGNAGDDSFYSIGTDDVVRGGAGDDLIELTSTDFADIDGGHGSDTLELNGADLTLDITAPQTSIQNFEVIDLSGTGDNTLVLDVLSVLRQSENTEGGVTTLIVHGDTTLQGDPSDTVQFEDEGWVNTGLQRVDGVTYNAFENGNARVLLGEGVAAYFPSSANEIVTKILGENAYDSAGWSVSDAGDVNGDGLADVIIGAPGADAAYVVYGGQDLGDVDLATLSAAQGFEIQGETAGDDFGHSVSRAGDVNGDGYDDLIIGADSADPGGTANAGVAFIIYGGQSLSNIDLSNGLTTAQGFALGGENAGDRLGFSVSSVGDVNGDGYDDFIMGAYRADGGNDDEGASYLIYGGQDFSALDLANLTMDQGSVLTGAHVDSYSGLSVSGAGDVNGDGFEDFIIGAPGEDDHTAPPGKAYIVYGGDSLAAEIDLDALSTNSSGFSVTAGRPETFLGLSVSAAGDVDGDGYDDLIVGAPFDHRDNGYLSGVTYVIYGGDALSDISDISALSADQGFEVQGAYEYYASGGSVSDAGDINGDGYDDLIIGPYGPNEAYVLYGGARGTLGDVDLANLDAAQGFVLTGDDAGSPFGVSVSSAGDVNGDGYDDLIIGAPFADGEYVGEGAAYIVYGGQTGTEDTAVVLASGTDVANNFTGNAGDDIFVDISTDDVVRGGAGDDTISITSIDFADIDGGHGTDTLELDGAGLTLDITSPQTSIQNFEVIDLSGSGDNTLVLDKLSVLRLSEDTAGGVTTLTVEGNSGDTVQFEDDGWMLTGTETSDSATYDIFDNGNARVRLSQDVSAELPGVTGDPSFSSGPTASVDEDLDVANDVVYTATARDPDNTAVTYSISGGADAARFIIESSTGAVKFAPSFTVDHETPGDTGGNNVYEIEITATDENNETATQTVEITVNDVADEVPVFAAGDTVSIAMDENETATGYTPSATPDLASDRVTYTIDGGVDSTLFEFDTNGQLVFKSAPDFESPADVSDGRVDGQDNVYEVRITASDGTNSSTQSVQVTVEDVTLGDTDNSMTLLGGRSNAQAGRSVSDAGDVNGDGIGDVIIGAPDAGYAYVVYGGQNLNEIDLNSLTGPQGFIILGNGDFASAVSGAGDVNGDGYDDVLVGAPDYDGAAGTGSGAAYLILGGQNPYSDNFIDVSNMSGDQGFAFDGESRFDYLGYSVSNAGDVNGDGFDDFIIGSRAAELGGDGAYIIYGGQDFSTIDLSNLSAEQGVRLTAPGGRSFAGAAVSGAGDVNGDGFEDVIVGAFYASANNILDSGAAYIVYGGDDLGTSIGLGSLATNGAGFAVLGEQQNATLGRNVSNAGDIDGDGYDDLLIGSAYHVGGAGASSGRAYIIYGGQSTADIDLSTLSDSQGFVVDGAGQGDKLALESASAGDINGDGYADLILGSDTNEAYVLYGGARGTLGDVDLANLQADQGFLIPGESGAGRSVSSAGDANGDGYDDLLIGAHSTDDGVNNQGAAYIVYGGQTGTESTTSLSQTGTDLADNFTGNAGDDIFFSIGTDDVVRGGAGDDTVLITATDFADIDGGHGYDTLELDGDGLELDITAPQTSIENFEAINLAGFGDNTLVLDKLSVLRLSEDTADGVTTLTVDGDSGDTVQFAESGWAQNGSETIDSVTYDIFENGNARVLVRDGVATEVVFDIDDLVDAHGFVLKGGSQGVRAGQAVASAGDVNGDGIDDILVGAPFADNRAGEAYIVFGGQDLSLLDLSRLDAAQGITISGESDPDWAGAAVASAGDVNGDGFDDVIVGTRYSENGGGQYTGDAYVIYGGQNLTDIDLSALSDSAGFAVRGLSDRDYLGRAVSSAGDVNGDGYDDIIVGAPEVDDASQQNIGTAYLIFGGETLSTIDDLTQLTADQGFAISGDDANDYAGLSVASAGDINGDGYEDLIVGVPSAQSDSALRNQGEAYIIFGGSTLGADIDLSNPASYEGFVVSGEQALDVAGQDVASAGDVNGDGFDDLIVTAPYNDENAKEAGATYIIFGSDAPVDVDLSALSADQGFVVRGDAEYFYSGWSAASAGDINGDGLDDLIIGSFFVDQSGHNEGRAYIIYGGHGQAEIDLANLNEDLGFAVKGAEAGDLFGTDVASAGDVNGDGYDDLIIGARFADNQGAAYIIYGGQTGTESTTSLSQTGTDVANNFTGNAGDDNFFNISTDDVVRGGAGDDTVLISTTDFADIDGGHGYDTLELDGDGLELDITAAQTWVQNFEAINLTNFGDNTLVLNKLSVLRLSEDTEGGVTTLTVDGNSGDTVQFEDDGWGQNGSETIDATTYTIYENGNARVLVDDRVTVDNPSMTASSTADASALNTVKLDGEDLGADPAQDLGVPEPLQLGDVPTDPFDLGDAAFDMIAALRGETLSQDSLEGLVRESDAGPSETVPGGQSPLPTFDQVWDADALAATLLNADMADVLNSGG